MTGANVLHCTATCRSILALVLSADVHQGVRIRRCLMAALVYAMCSLLLLYGVFKLTIDANDGGALVLGMQATSLFFYGALRSGWNQRFGDPSLTVAQILVGLCWSCLGYAIANEGHGGVLVPFFMVLVVGVFNMSRTQAIGVSVCALLGMGSVMLYKAATAPDVYRPHIQAAFFVMLTTIVPLIAAWAGTVSQMRKRIMEQKLQLASAMQRFAAHGELPVLEGDGAAREMGELWQQFADLARHRRELDERRSTMLAAISHDLRSPLTRIRMAAELLPKAEDVEVRREVIVRNIDVANRLLSNFIDMARADHEPIEDRVDLRALVLDVALSAPEVRLGELPAKPQWLAPASAVALERALLNLIDNARVYIDAVSRALMDSPPASGLCIAGLGDFSKDTMDILAALGGVPDHMPRILLQHQPDAAEDPAILAAPRIDLMLSGHTHGGQIRFPILGAPVTLSRYGQKYAGGLAQGPRCPVIVSRGLGMSFLPVRIGVRPELVEITLIPA